MPASLDMNSPGLATRPERAADRRVVSVRAPGRLHLGFLDPGGSLGRRYGSLGLVVDGFETQVDLSGATARRVTGATPSAQAEIDRAESHLHVLQRQTGLTQPLHLHLEKVLPAHAGLGSGTQLALAVFFGPTRLIDNRALASADSSRVACWSTAGRDPTASPRRCCRGWPCPTPGAWWSCLTRNTEAFRVTRKSRRSPLCRPCPGPLLPTSATRC